MKTVTFKSIAVGVAAAYFNTQCAGLYATESRFWQERLHTASSSNVTQLAALPSFAALPRISPKFTFLSAINGNGISFSSIKNASGRALLNRAVGDLPPTLGSVRSIRLPADGIVDRVVLHFEDIHLNAEAQGNLSKTLTRLFSQRRVDALGLEGDFSDMSSVFGNRHPGDPIYQKAVDYSLKRNDISGPVHAALLFPGPLPVIAGIDDRVHYEKNVAAIREGAAAAKQANRQLDSEDRALAQKEKDLNPSLRRIESAVRAYHRGALPLAAYVERLAGSTAVVSPNIANFLGALRLEKELDFARVEQERNALLARLTPRLTPSRLSSLLDDAVRFKSGALRQSDFYGRLDELARTAGVSLNDYPVMKSFVRYALLADAVRADGLFDDLTVLERTSLSALTRTNRERSIVAEAARLDLSRKLVNFALTRNEWDEYKSVRGSRFSSFESFYEEAEARDHAMASNVETLLNKTGAAVAAVVTGGFHDAGLTRALTTHHVAVVAFVPMITKIETNEGTINLGVFTREKTPLEKLFAGEKISVSPRPAGGIWNLPFHVVAEMKSENRVGLPYDWVHSYASPATPLPGYVDIQATRNGHEIREIIQTSDAIAQRTYRLSDNGDLEGDEETTEAAESRLYKLITDRLENTNWIRDMIALFKNEEEISPTERSLWESGREKGLPEEEIVRLLVPERIARFPVVLARRAPDVYIEYEEKFGYRVLHGAGEDKHKGGTRFDLTAILRELISLATDMTGKVLLHGLPLRGGKGGIAIDPNAYSDKERARWMRSYVRGLLREGVDHETDCPAPDMATADLMAVFLDEIYRQYAAKNRSSWEALGLDVREDLLLDPDTATPREWAALDLLDYPDEGLGTPYADAVFAIPWDSLPEPLRKLAESVTGKPVEMRGLQSRGPATGDGVGAVTREAAMRYLGKRLEGLRITIQGGGKVGEPLARWLASHGALIVGMGEREGVIENPQGLDVPAMFEYRKEHKTFEGFDQPGTVFDKERDGVEALFVEADVAIPAAAGGVLTEMNAQNIKAFLTIEAANNPFTVKGEKAYIGLIVPGELANGGGVTVSYYEMRNDTGHFADPSRAGVLQRLDEHLTALFHHVSVLADKNGISLRKQTGRVMFHAMWLRHQNAQKLVHESGAAMTNGAATPSKDGTITPDSHDYFSPKPNGAPSTPDQNNSVLGTIEEILDRTPLSQDVVKDVPGPLNITMAPYKAESEELTVQALRSDQWKSLSPTDRRILLLTLNAHHHDILGNPAGHVILALDHDDILSDVEKLAGMLDQRIFRVISTSRLFFLERGRSIFSVAELVRNLGQEPVREKLGDLDVTKAERVQLIVPEGSLVRLAGVAEGSVFRQAAVTWIDETLNAVRLEFGKLNLIEKAAKLADPRRNA